MSQDQLQRSQKDKQQWIQCDPITLVAAARDELYKSGSVDQPATSAVEEVLSRFEHQTRATVGGSQIASQFRPQ